VQEPPAANLHDYENIKNTKACRDRDHEVAGNDRSSVIANEGSRSLRCASIRFQLFRPIGPHGSRRYGDAEFEQQLRRHSSLTPRGVLPNHFGNQNSEILRESRPSTGPPAFPTPEKLECTSCHMIKVQALRPPRHSASPNRRDQNSSKSLAESVRR